jgi:hypothetical protein
MMRGFSPETGWCRFRLLRKGRPEAALHSRCGWETS